MNNTAPRNDILERAITELRQRRKSRAGGAGLFAALKKWFGQLLPRRTPRPGSAPRLALAAYSTWANAGDYRADRIKLLDRAAPGRIG